MGKKEEWRPMPFFGSNRWLDDLLEDLRWEEATEAALKKQGELYRAASPPSPEELKEKKYKTG